MELLKDYDYSILYHLGEANVVADACVGNQQAVLLTSALEDDQLLKSCMN